jgi:hypothetical protein
MSAETTKAMIVDAESGEVIERELTADEIAAHQAEVIERQNATTE